MESERAKEETPVIFPRRTLPYCVHPHIYVWIHLHRKQISRTTHIQRMNKRTNEWIDSMNERIRSSHFLFMFLSSISVFNSHPFKWNQMSFSSFRNVDTDIHDGMMQTNIHHHRWFACFVRLHFYLKCVHVSPMYDCQMYHLTTAIISDAWPFYGRSIFSFI